MQLCMVSRVESCTWVLETQRRTANVSYRIISWFDPHPLVDGLLFLIIIEYMKKLIRSAEGPHTGANSRSQRVMAPPKQK